MASVTLAESAKLAQNELIAGVIENVITVNKFFQVLPFDALDGNDQTAIQVASKAKSAGRKFQDMLINGDGTGNTLTGLISLVAAGQTIAPTDVNGDALSFSTLDNLMDLVTDKDGAVDYFTLHARTIRSYLELLRGLGGAGINETVELPDSTTVAAYRGVPMFRNDWTPINRTTGATNTTTVIFAGTLDDGSRQHGIAGLTASNQAGIHVVDVGEKELADEHIWRVKWYAGLALFSLKGLAMADGITN